MIKSKITGKTQTTISQLVRFARRLCGAYDLAYRIEGGHPPLTDADRKPTDDPFVSFSEWWSEVDRRAFTDL
jgi:antitoxin PrlF